jgi:non-ribosomal peptide synthetase component E (peptide arylation enzyme)
MPLAALPTTAVGKLDKAAISRLASADHRSAR